MITMTKTIKRRIASETRHLNPGSRKHWAVGGSITLVLAECGHTQYRKLSRGVPESGLVRCLECEELRDAMLNGSTRSQKLGDGPSYQLGWNEELGLPTRTHNGVTQHAGEYNQAQ
jgi:hypothetical protein